MTKNKMKATSLTHKKIQGLSLIEMMVSMVVGLFLIGGLTTMYLGSKKSDKFRTEVSHMEENARTALSSLRLAIEHAGYKSVDNIPLDNPIQVEGVIRNETCRDNDPMVTNLDLITPPTEFAGYTRDNPYSDRITVVFRADNPNRGPIHFDCMGGNYNEDASRQIACSTDPVNGMGNTWNSKIYNGIYVDLTDKTLRCFGSRSVSGSQVMAENIENMQIRYGVTKSNNTTYKSASTVNNDWSSVTSIQVALLVSSERDVLEHAETQSFQLLDQSVTKSHDRKLYRVYSTTVNLPNRNRRLLSTVSGGESGVAAR